MSVSRPGSLAGVHADRPAATDLPAGTLWLSTDQDGGTTYRTDGSSWTQIALGVSAASSSPLTTKGDVYTHDGSADARLPVGADGKWLKANSAQTTGLEWADPPGAYAETIGDGSATSFAVTHSLGTEDVHVQVWDVSGTDPVLANGDPSSVTATDTNTVTVAFGSAPTTDQYRVVVLASGSSGSSGGMALIEEIELAADGTFSFSSIPSTHKDLMLVGRLRSDHTGLERATFRVGNGTVATTGYLSQRIFINQDNTIGSAEETDGFRLFVVDNNDTAGRFSPVRIMLPGYADDQFKNLHGDGGLSDSAANAVFNMITGSWDSTSAIDVIEVTPQNGTNFKTGSVLRLYGLS